MGEQKIVHVSLYDDQPFVNCRCDLSEKKPYSIEHNPKPLKLPPKMIDTLEMLLWYSPNVLTSKQSFKNDYLNNPLFENAIITYYLRYLELQPEDLCFVAGKTISEDLVKPYLDNVCQSCKKIIVAKAEGQTKLSSIFHHLRNCLAHGRFNLLSDDTFIGIDEFFGQYSAVFKLNITEVYEFCKQLILYPDFTVSHVFQYILMKEGYTVLQSMTGAYNFRNMEKMEELLFAIKGDFAFRINCSRYRLDDSIDNFEIIDEYVNQNDDQLHKNVNYIDIYYCEKELGIRKLAENKYTIGLSVLESFYRDNLDIIEYLR